MSFEIFFNAYEHGEPCAFPLSDAEAAFQTAIVCNEGKEGRYFWRLEYPAPILQEQPRVIHMNGRDYPVEVRDISEVYGRILPSDGPSSTDGFMVKGPAAHPDFYAALLKLLQSAHAVLFWPGENSLVIGQMETVKHLPEGMVETLGEPFLVTEPMQIIDRINSSD
jgi:hypothetical protein